jgi:hypothetical protein
MPEYGAAHFDICLNDLYHPEHNPNGYISLAVAENVLVGDLLKKKMGDLLKKKMSPPPFLDTSPFVV